MQQQQRWISRLELAEPADQRVAVRGPLTPPRSSRKPGGLALVPWPFGVVAEFRRADQRGVRIGLRQDAAAARRPAAAVGVLPAAGLGEGQESDAGPAGPMRRFRPRRAASQRPGQPDPRRGRRSRVRPGRQLLDRAGPRLAGRAGPAPGVPGDRHRLPGVPRRPSAGDRAAPAASCTSARRPTRGSRCSGRRRASASSPRWSCSPRSATSLASEAPASWPAGPG